MAIIRCERCKKRSEVSMPCFICDTNLCKDCFGDWPYTGCKRCKAAGKVEIDQWPKKQVSKKLQ